MSFSIVLPSVGPPCPTRPAGVPSTSALRDSRVPAAADEQEAYGTLTSVGLGRGLVFDRGAGDPLFLAPLPRMEWNREKGWKREREGWKWEGRERDREVVERENHRLSFKIK